MLRLWRVWSDRAGIGEGKDKILIFHRLSGYNPRPVERRSTQAAGQPYKFMARRRKKIPQEPVTASIESLSHDGRGVTHLNGKTTFVVGALPGEEVVFKYTSTRRSHDEGQVQAVLKASPDRVEPKCAHVDVCGGCSLQHMDPARQILAKQQTLLENFQRIGGVEPEQVMPPLTGPVWGYRRKARLGVRYVHKKGRVLVGFRERHGGWVAQLGRCEILDENVGSRLVELGDVIGRLEAYKRIAQIEVAVGDTGTALVFRNLDPLSEADMDILRDYAKETGIWVYLQPEGPDSIFPLYPQEPQLAYRLDEYDVEYQFRPSDFTQVNAGINQAMIPLALSLLDPQPDDRVLDLFCGLGNFSLPLARQIQGGNGEVVAVEGAPELVERAIANAARNGLSHVQFHAADLFKDFKEAEWAQQPFDKLLLDPARSGAQEVCADIERLGPEGKKGGGPARIVYVSCHPGTLARDAGILVKEKGYRLVKAGVMDMFPHTAHVESIALFERDPS